MNKVLEIARATKTAEIKKRPAKKKEKKKTARAAEEGDDLDFVEFADFSKFGVDEKEREQFTQFTELLVQFKLNGKMLCKFICILFKNLFCYFEELTLNI